MPDCPTKPECSIPRVAIRALSLASTLAVNFFGNFYLFDPAAT